MNIRNCFINDEVEKNYNLKEFRSVLDRKLVFTDNDLEP